MRLPGAVAGVPAPAGRKPGNPLIEANARRYCVSMNAPRIGRPRTTRGPRGKVAEALRAARAARRLSQAQAATELGIVQSVLARWESGARRPAGLALRYLIEVWIPRSLEGRKEGANR